MVGCFGGVWEPGESSSRGEGVIEEDLQVVDCTPLVAILADAGGPMATKGRASALSPIRFSSHSPSSLEDAVCCSIIAKLIRYKGRAQQLAMISVDDYPLTMSEVYF